MLNLAGQISVNSAQDMLPPSACGCSTFLSTNPDFQSLTIRFYSTHFSFKNWYLRGDDWLINSRWEELISMRNELTFVEMVTW